MYVVFLLTFRTSTTSIRIAQRNDTNGSPFYLIIGTVD